MKLLRAWLVVLAMLLPSVAMAQAPQAPPDASSTEFVAQVFGITGAGAQAAAEVLNDTAAPAAVANNIDDIMSIDPDKAMEGYKSAQKAGLAQVGKATALGAAGKLLSAVGKGMNAYQLGSNLLEGDWREATKNGAALATDLAAGKAITSMSAAAAVFVCGVTAGVGCLIGVAAVTAVASSVALESASRYVGGKLFDSVCSYRPDSKLCDQIPGRNQSQVMASNNGTMSGQTPQGRGAAGQSGGGAASNTSGSTGGGSAGRGPPADGGSYGRTAINVVVGGVVTTAVGRGKAITDIGTSKGGNSRLNVKTGTVVTTSTGKRTETVIGRGSGTVVTGMVANIGGNLTIGDNGRSSRDGKTCLRFYLTLCIVKMYPRPPKKPCPPPPWLFGLGFCMLPADYKHSVVGKL